MANPQTDGRMLNKAISDSKKFAALSEKAAVLFAMLVPHYNSHGKMNGDPGYVKGVICPRIPYIDVAALPALLQEISDKTNTKWFEHDGRYWIHNTKFLTDHQKLDPKKLGRDLLPTYSRVSPELVTHEVEVEVEEEDQVEGEEEGEEETFPPLFDNEFPEDAAPFDPGPDEPEAEEPAPPPPPQPDLTLDVQFWRAFSAKVPGAMWGKGSAAERAREGVIRIIGELGGVSEAVDAYMHAAGGCDCDKTAHRRIPTGSIAMLTTLVIDQIDESSRALSKGKAKIFKRSDYAPGKVG